MKPGSDSEESQPRFVRRSPLSTTPKLCPRCLNPLTRGSKLGGWLVPQDYYCPKCNYSGTVYLESDTALNPSEEDKV